VAAVILANAVAVSAGAVPGGSVAVVVGLEVGVPVAGGVGVAGVYVNALVHVTSGASVTVTLTVPVPGGVVARSWVSLSTVNEVAAVVPKFTPVAGDVWKPLPVMVTLVPPAAGPDVGVIARQLTVTANAVGTSAAGSVSARIIRTAEPNLMNLRLNIHSPLEVPLDAPFVRRLGRVEIRLGATMAPTN